MQCLLPYLLGARHIESFISEMHRHKVADSRGMFNAIGDRLYKPAVYTVVSGTLREDAQPLGGSAKEH